MVHDLLILTSPPASGKTYWISQLRKELPRNKSILVISPLRALADECKRNWGDSIKVMTPEEWLGKKPFCDVIIFDEFHLFFYWGDTFRPLMWEMFFEISMRPALTILLTATLAESMKAEVELFRCHFDQMLWVDCGNQTLRNLPSLYLRAPNKKWVSDCIFSEPKERSVKLIFCRFRNEVFEWEKILVRNGYSCISCVGGEAKFMASKLDQNPRPDFIVSTTVLSHGVNLPTIEKIFFTYAVSNLDFWIQMVARGGRKGETFEVIALEKPCNLPFNPFKNFLLIGLKTIHIKVVRHLFPLFS